MRQGVEGLTLHVLDKIAQVRGGLANINEALRRCPGHQKTLTISRSAAAATPGFMVERSPISTRRPVDCSNWRLRRVMSNRDGVASGRKAMAISTSLSGPASP